MKKELRTFLALLMCELLVGLLLPAPAAAQSELHPAVLKAFQENLRKSYLELFEIAPTLEFSPAQIERMRQYIKQSRRTCIDRFKQRGKDLDAQLRQAQAELKQLGPGPENKTRRHDLHCRIQNLRVLKSQTLALANHAIPVAYDNREAKLDLIEKWPAALQQIKQELADGSYRKRRWGDVEDIGFREIEPGQEKDIKIGEEAIRQMKMLGMMPREVTNEYVVRYVTEVARKVASHSDLQVPLRVTVLDAKEINAFALPGGFVFVQRGLLEAVDDEAELAGVLGHEISHVVARHGHKLMRKSTIASLIYQGAQLAAMILTGGAVGIGTYYALQYGFYGLGMVMNLKLLGVSREFEMQADQLGVQYTWNSGYDPTGFIRFFDKMATHEGYVNGAGWFRSHPPFFERMVNTEREIRFLPKKDEQVVTTPEFKKMKEELAKVVAEAKKEEEGRPSLLAPEQGCPAPEKPEYKPGQPIETLCGSPGEQQTGAR